MATKEDAMAVFEDTLSCYFYYDRKASETLPLEDLNNLMKSGELTEDDLIEVLKKVMR